MDFGYSLADFAKRAVTGHRWQEFLAEVLRGHGLHVRSTPLKVRKEDEDHEPYRDESDLEVSANRRLWHIVEAKSKSGPGEILPHLFCCTCISLVVESSVPRASSGCRRETR